MTCTLDGQPDPVSVAGTLTVSVSGGTPGALVDVTLDNGEGGQDTVTIQLDSNGDGSTGWTVPAGWDTITITSPGCQVAAVTVV